ncbi:MAG TPA: hypothetical protein VHE35_01090 [Kofleriaceae bacterium]|nr:hypothetical protein [Kofleriaceae bacterium]
MPSACPRARATARATARARAVRALAAAAVTLPLAGRARAEPLDVDYAVDVTTVSAYVWRGELMSPAALAPAAQPYVELGLSPLHGGRLAAGAWTSAFLGARDPAYELDPYLSYAAPCGPTTITAGYAVYLQTAGGPAVTMEEASLQVALDGHRVTPSAGVATDLVVTESWYAWAALAHQADLGPLTLATRLEVGASDGRMVEAALQDATLSARGSLPLGGGAYVAATGAVAYAPRSDRWTPTLAMSVGVAR